MIRRLYVHNYRCLENFELKLAGLHSALLIGKNGSGKSTVSAALEIFQKIGRGMSRIQTLVSPGDFSRQRSDAPMRFEIEVEIEQRTYQYALALELPAGFKELRVLDEQLTAEGETVYSRTLGQVSLNRGGKAVNFPMDWHMAALSVMRGSPNGSSDPLQTVQQWLGRMLILRPVPRSMAGDSSHATLQPDPQVENYGAWFSGVLAEAPSAYQAMIQFLRKVLPDLKELKNPMIGSEARSLSVQFAASGAEITIPFAKISDGEKCFMICALAIAAQEAFGPLFCFWDEPDNFLALHEIGPFVLDLRRRFQGSGQFLATSHNSQAIQHFADENTFLLQRKSHLEPTTVRATNELDIVGDLVGALIRDDIPE